MQPRPSRLADSLARLGAILSTVFGLSALVSLTLWCAAGLLLARAMRSDAQWRVLNAALGVLLALSVVPTWFEFSKGA